jgi:acetate kinase
LTDAILVLNAGSSSIKFSLFPGEHEPARHDIYCEGQCAGIGHSIHFTAPARRFSTSICRKARAMRTR